MKTRKYIYLTIGVFLVALNLLLDIMGFYSSLYATGDTAYNIGVFIGGHFLLFIGLIFLRAGYKLNKKLKERDEDLLEAEVDLIGKPDQ